MQAEPVKAHLRAAQELLVTSLYNLAPLLDCLLSHNLLSPDNYYQVRMESIPLERARKLLEVVHAQMDESGAAVFLECLRKCERHYPRLRTWLREKRDLTCESNEADIQCGPTEHRLRVQFPMLCHRLGASAFPVSIQLFSAGILTQIEQDQVDAERTCYEKSHKLLSICLSKGEGACVYFYKALGVEDPFLAADVETTAPPGSEISSSLIRLAIEESSAAPQLGQNPSGIQRCSSWEADSVANEERGVLHQAVAVLGLTLDTGCQLNVCELGVALGLRREDVRDHFLEDVDISDMAQMSSLVDLFLEKTQDKARLLRKLAACDIKSLQLSKRGSLLLQLLSKAESLLHSGHSHAPVGHIFSFLLRDSLAEAVEEPQEYKESGADPWSGVRGALRQLQGVAGSMARADPELLVELHESFHGQQMAEGLLQGVRALAQLLRDLYPLQDRLQLLDFSLHQGAMVSCRPSRLHRVTRFHGISGRAVTRALGVLPQQSEPPQVQYQGICQAVARLLERVWPSQRGVDPYATLSAAQRVCTALSHPAFGPKAFDSGMRHRLLALLEFDPTVPGLDPLLPLHRDCLGALEAYLRSGVHHGFQLHPEGIQLLEGEGKVHLASSVTGPIAIDDGLEETFRLLTSGALSVLIRLCCYGYKDGAYFQVFEPHCVFLSGLKDGGTKELQDMGLQVLWAESRRVWVRQAKSRAQLLTLAREHSGEVQDAGLCFLLRTQGPQCEVTFMYKRDRITAVSKSNCEVL